MKPNACLTIEFEGPTEDGWFVAQIREIPGALSQGRTREEARENVIDALCMLLEFDESNSVPTDVTEPLPVTLLV